MEWLWHRAGTALTAFHGTLGARTVLGGEGHVLQVLHDQPPCSRLPSNLETISKTLSKPWRDWKVEMGKEQPKCAWVESASPAESCTHSSTAPEQAGAGSSASTSPAKPSTGAGKPRDTLKKETP